ncbi:ESCRT-II complex, vps25 subunit, partial [Backusella circina FSU 941]
RQITESTWQNQVGQWEQLILSYAKHKHVFRLDVHAATSPGGGEIFENNKIKRKNNKSFLNKYHQHTQNIGRLSFELLQEIIDEMVKRGTAEWDSKEKTEALINETGQNNQVVTFYELCQGELVQDQEFYMMDNTLLNKALQILVKRGNAQIFKGTDQDSMGVKFFG